MTKNKKTILLISGVYLPHLGGVERYTFELASRLKSDYNVVIITTNTEGLAFDSVEDGVRVFRLPIKNLPQKNRLPFLKKDAEYKQFMSEIRALEVNHVIINTRLYETTFLGLKIAKEKGIRPWIIDHSGGYVLKPYERVSFKKLSRFGLKNIDFYSVSKANQKFLKNEFGIVSKGIFYNAIEPVEAPRKPKNEKIKILYAGRIMKTKGIEPLLSSFAKIEKKYNVELEILGDGPLLEKMKATPRKNVKFLGKVSHDKVLEKMDKSDIFVFPVLAPEGFPSVLLEAGIRKNAIIATKFLAMEELVGEDGILIDRKAELLEEAFEELLKNPEKITEYQEKIRKRVIENFTWERTINKVKMELEK